MNASALLTDIAGPSRRRRVSSFDPLSAFGLCLGFFLRFAEIIGAELLREPIDPPEGIDESGAPVFSEEGVAGGANLDLDFRHGASGGPGRSAPATHRALHVLGMNAFFHGPLNLPR